jgi:hypothetical protein
MTDALPSLNRRRLLGVCASLPLLGRAGPALAMRSVVAAPVLPESATMLVAGPEGAVLDRWSRLLAPALAQSMPPELAIRRTLVGAPDGVTGANQFGARTAPDGQTVLLAPGDAVLAWLVGDPRAQYDVGLWLAAMAGLTCGVLVARPGAVAPGRTVRLPTSGLAAGELPAILGLDGLGARVALMPAMTDEMLPAAFTQGAIDAAFLRGAQAEPHVRALAQVGAVPVFSLGLLDPAGKLQRCPAFHGVPTLPEMQAAWRRSWTPAMRTAWGATAVATQLDFALVLPQLTPAAMVALWRSAATEAAASLDVQAVARAATVRLVAGNEAAAAINAAGANQPALLALRGWLTTRYNWKPA